MEEISLSNVTDYLSNIESALQDIDYSSEPNKIMIIVIIYCIFASGYVFYKDITSKSHHRAHQKVHTKRKPNPMLNGDPVSQSQSKISKFVNDDKSPVTPRRFRRKSFKKGVQFNAIPRSSEIYNPPSDPDVAAINFLDYYEPIEFEKLAPEVEVGNREYKVIFHAFLIIFFP